MSERAGYGRGYYGDGQLDQDPRSRRGNFWIKVALAIGAGAAIWFMWPRPKREEDSEEPVTGEDEPVSFPVPPGGVMVPQVYGVPMMPQAYGVPMVAQAYGVPMVPQSYGVPGYPVAQGYPQQISGYPAQISGYPQQSNGAGYPQQSNGAGYSQQPNGAGRQDYASYEGRGYSSPPHEATSPRYSTRVYASKPAGGRGYSSPSYATPSYATSYDDEDARGYASARIQGGGRGSRESSGSRGYPALQPYPTQQAYEDAVVTSAQQLQATGAKVVLAPHLAHLTPRLAAPAAPESPRPGSTQPGSTQPMAALPAPR